MERDARRHLRTIASRTGREDSGLVDPIYLLVAAVIVALPFVLTKLLGGKSREASKVLGAYTPAAKLAAEPAPDAVPIEVQVKALIAQNRKIEAIKLMRET